jgi:predicted lysophospholipase L1 biosynthesis ABC-type transport system permease subunit
VTFGASLDRLAASPRQQGWNFDVVVGNLNAQTDQEAEGVRLLGRNPHVGGFAAIASPAETPTINGVSVSLAGFDVLKGAMGPVMLDGQAPRSPTDVVVARATMRRLHAHIGDVVRVVAGAKTAPMRISGVMLSTSAGSLFSGRLDEGAAVTLQGLRRVEPGALVTLFLVDYARASDRDVAFARLQHDFGPNVLQRLPARDIENLVRVDNLPWLLAGLLAVLSVATLFQTLTASVRRRDHELAILKALGFERGQLAASMVWQMWALALVGIALGVPFGIIIARTAWKTVAENIGSVQQAVMPTGMITLLVALSALVVTALALAPAWLAARVNAATALRRE